MQVCTRVSRHADNTGSDVRQKKRHNGEMLRSLCDKTTEILTRNRNQANKSQPSD